MTAVTIPVASTRADLDVLLAPAGRIAVVMTMGALHDGHARLVRVARQHAGAEGTVVVTVFVNPTQFAAGEDFDRYPRTLDADLAVCSREAADVVYAPAASDVYGAGSSVTVDPGPLGDVLEGAARPGHFRGVLTVVAKLMARTRADVAVFGEKDYQQLTLIRRMVTDLDLPVEVVGVPTVREPDGLALSSRNAYLTPAQRASAAAIPAACAAGVRAAASGGDARAVEAAARTVLDGEPGLSVGYVAVRGPLLDEPPRSGPARLLVAVRDGDTRLIDNVPLLLTGTDTGTDTDTGGGTGTGGGVVA